MAGEFKISDVLPWGRNAAEYRAMFSLDDFPPGYRILDVGGGPASFNAEFTAENAASVVSVDPLYSFPVEAIRSRVVETRAIMMGNVRKATSRFVWKYFANPVELEATRLATMETFLADFERGLADKRYVPGALPSLRFAQNSFNLILCSHMLFMYSDVLDEAFHIASLKEMLRIAPEARLFPLQDISGNASRHLAPVLAWADQSGIGHDVRPVDYEFQKDANEMLVLRRHRD